MFKLAKLKFVFSPLMVFLRFLFFFPLIVAVWGNPSMLETEKKMSVALFPIYSNTLSSDSRFLMKKDEKDVKKMIKISFFPESPEYRKGDSFTFHMTIENNSTKKVFSYKNFDEPFQQFLFTVKKGYQDYSIKHLNYYRFLYDRNTYSDSHRVISLNPQESYSKMVSLGTFFKFDHPGFYEVTGEFYPLGVSESDYRIPIQPFVLRIHPRQQYLSDINSKSLSKKTVIKQIPRLIEGPVSISDNQVGISKSVKEEGNRQITPLFPDEVVQDHFNRIRTYDYAGYLNNLELEQLLVNSYQSSEAYLRYQEAKVYEKEVIIEDFKKFLIEKIDYSLIDSMVLKTTVIKDSAVVEAIMAVREPFESYHQGIDPYTGETQPLWVKESINRLEKFYYLTFDLMMIPKIDNSKPWKIIAYIVRSLSIEQYQNYKNRIPSIGKPILPSMHSQEQQNQQIDDRLNHVIHFGYNQSVIEQKYLPQIEKFTQFLVAYPKLLIELYGHTDDRGEEDYNYELSKERVESVASYLIAGGVELSRMRFFYKGESEPITYGQTDGDHRLNRRVEIKIFKPQF